MTNASKRSGVRFVSVLELLEQRQLLSAFQVNSSGDNPSLQGTLAYAIAAINALPPGSDSEIDFDIKGTASLTQGPLVLSGNDQTVDIEGNKQAVTTSSAGGLLQITGSGTHVMIDNLTMTGTAGGTGIEQTSGQLTLQYDILQGFAQGLVASGQAADIFYTTFTNNYGLGNGSGAAIDVTEGTDSAGDPYVFYATGCTITDNGGGNPRNDQGGPAVSIKMTAANDVAGIENSTISTNLDGAIVSGATNSTARFFVDSSTINGNLSHASQITIVNGSNLLNGNSIASNSQTDGSVIQFTANLNGNAASGSELDEQGMSIVNNTSYSAATPGYGTETAYLGAGTVLTLNDVTIGGNLVVGSGGGLSVTGYPASGGIAAQVSITSSTIADNSAFPLGNTGGIAYGGGLLADGVAVDLDNTIVAGNSAGNGADVYTDDSSLSGDYDLIGDGSGVTGLGSHSLLNVVNVGLAPLSNYGSETPAQQTYALYSNSPAVNAGDPGKQQTADENGDTRVADAIDIGADNSTIAAPSGGGNTGGGGSGGTGTGGTGTGNTGPGSTETGSTGPGSTGTGSTGSGSTGTGATGNGTTGIAPPQVSINLHHDRVVAIREHHHGVVNKLVLRYNPRYATGFVSVTLAPLAHPLVVRQLLPHHKVVDQVLSAGTELTLYFGPEQLGVDAFINAL